MASTHSSSKFEIKLKGESSLLLAAERAVIHVDIENTGLDKQKAAQETLKTTRQVEALLRKLGPQSSTSEAKDSAPIDFWSRTSMAESSYQPSERDGKSIPREYTADVDFEAHFKDFTAISGFIDSLSELPYVETNPVKWILREETKDLYRSELRINAAKNAKQKALEYAQALGYNKVIPFELQEATVYVASSNRKMGRIAADVGASKKNFAEVDAEGWTDVGGAVWDYQPEDIELRAAVDASFFAEI